MCLLWLWALASSFHAENLPVLGTDVVSHPGKLFFNRRGSMAEQYRIDLARRRFLAGLAAAGASATVPVAFSETFLAQPAEARGSGIAEIVPDLNRIHKWDNSNGDTWDPFWADDDSLYAFNCDGRGFG